MPNVRRNQTPEPEPPIGCMKMKILRLSLDKNEVIGDSEKAVAQSPKDMMNMMMGGGNMTDGTMMMGGSGGNMSLPFNMGVLAMPLMCTTPNQLLGSLTDMFGGGMMTGDDGNTTQQMIMGLMRQQMMSQVGGMGGMTDSELQQVMNLVVCIPMIGDE